MAQKNKTKKRLVQLKPAKALVKVSSSHRTFCALTAQADCSGFTRLFTPEISSVLIHPAATRHAAVLSLLLCYLLCLEALVCCAIIKYLLCKRFLRSLNGSG